MSETYEPPKGTDVGLDFYGNYAAPKGGVVGLDFPFNRCRYIYYKPPKGNKVGLDFSEPYTPPLGGFVGINFTNCPDGHEPKEEQFIHPTGFDSLTVGDHKIERFHQFISPHGFESHRFGDHTAYLYTRHIVLAGFNASSYGRPSVKNLTDQVWPRGFDASEYGRPRAYNLTQYLRPNGYDASEFYDHFVQGGVSYISPRGFDSLRFGNLEIPNYEIKPRGFSSSVVGRPDVHPRMIYPEGFLSGIVGDNHNVQFPPQPKGWLSDVYGTPWVSHSPRAITTELFDTLEVFPPEVRDRAKYIYPSSVVGQGVFGDTNVKLVNFKISVEGFDSFESSDWATVTTNKRAIEGRGFDSQAFGNAEIRNAVPSLYPIGFESFLPTEATLVSYRIRTVRAPGFDHLVFGRPSLTQTPSISPEGFEGDYGEPTITHGIRTIELKGFESQLFGELDIWFRYRNIEADGFNSSRVGEPLIEFKDRGIETLGSKHDRYGTPSIGDLHRIIEPPSIFEEYPTRHIVGGDRYIEVVGFEATEWGTRIIPIIQTIYPLGFSNEYGWPTVENHTIYVEPKGFTTTQQPQDQWGDAKVFNSRQYIELQYDSNSELEPPPWPKWTLIENRNKTIGAIGINTALYGRPQIDNKARPILPPGIEAPSQPDWYKAGMVSYRVRELPVEGIEAPYISGWHNIRNDAFVIAPEGFDSFNHGSPDVETNRKSYKLQGWESEELGTPMISFLIRNITFESRYGIAPPIINLPTVDLHTKYIDVFPFENDRYGNHSLSIHWNIIQTRWAHRDLFGEGEVINLTPEIETRGRDSAEFGDAFVRTQWREVITDGNRTDIIPRPVIAFRDRSMEAHGIGAPRVSDKLKVELERPGPPPLVDQNIYLFRVYINDDDEEKEEGFGIPPEDAYGRPRVVQNVIRPDGFNASRFGEADTHSNGIIVENGIWERLKGVPFISLKNREISLSGDEGDGGGGIDNTILVGKPSISPQTIWAVKEAPKQAIDNHYEWPFLHYVGETRTRPPGVVFGRPRVSIPMDVPIRPVGFLGGNSTTYIGTPKVENSRKYIEPRGWASSYVGWHSMPSDIQVGQYDSHNSSEFGRPIVAPPPYTGPQEIKHQGFDATLFGNTSVENQHREIEARGFNSLAMGTRKEGDNPYMWQGLRIGPYVPFELKGFENSKYGEPWVSHRVRELRVVGFESFMSEYDRDNFDLRMRVTTVTEEPERDLVSTVGNDMAQIGTPNIKLRTHYILPDGNSDQFRKGAP